MGASNFVQRVVAVSARDGFSRLAGDAEVEYGRDRYNGTISTCDMGRLRQTYDKPTDTNRKKAMKFIRDNAYGDKWVADYIDMGVVEYRVITIKKENIESKKPPVIRIKFTVRGLEDGYKIGKIEKYFDTKKEADDYAISLAIINNREYFIYKEGVLVEGEAVVSRIVKEEKKYNTKPNLKPMPNRKIIEMHEYIFYGWASE